MFDIQFKKDDFAFNCRVAAVILKENKTLLQRAISDDYWTYVGGKVSFGENSADGVLRECREELGAELQIDHLIAFIENFFRYPSGELWHQFIFLYKLSDKNSQLELFDGERPILDSPSCVCKWFDISELDNIIIKPACTVELLKKTEQNNLHIINTEL